MAKYEPKDDGLRKELIDFITQDVECENNSKSMPFNMDACNLDVTGSLGCWGIEDK